MEDVFPGYEEYLLLLQEKNRLVKKLRKKDKKQVQLERKEQGFSLYVNGANADIKPDVTSPPSSKTKGKLPRTAGEIRKHNGPLTHRDLENLAREERERMREKQRAKTAPSKTRRKNWNVESIEVTTDKGSSRKIHAPEILTGRYEEDFESDDDDDDIEIDATSHSRPLSPKKTSYVKKQADLNRQEVEENRMTLKIGDVKRLRQSLEMNNNIKQSLAMEISSDESGDELAPTIEEESEEEVEEEINMSVDTIDQKKSPFKPGDTIVLEFAPNLKRKQERNLSTIKRKDNNDSVLLSARKSQENLISPRSNQKVILKETTELQSVSKNKKELKPLSSKKSYSSNTLTDNQEEANAVLAALQAENAQVAKYSKESKTKIRMSPDKLMSKSPRPSALTPSSKSLTFVQSPRQKSPGENLSEEKLGEIVDKVLIMSPKQQCRLVKLLEKLDTEKIKTNNNNTSVSNRGPLKALYPISSSVHKQISDNDIEVNIEILSNWGHPSRLGLTEFQFYNQHKQLVAVDASNVTVHGVQQAYAPLDVLFNGKTKTTKERYMWVCDFSGKRVEFVIKLKNPVLENSFNLSSIKIWNWNKSINGLDMGGKHVRVFIGGELMYDGDLDKGCGNHIYDYSTTIQIKTDTHKNSSDSADNPALSRESSHHTFRSISRSSLSSASSSSSSRPVSATQQSSPVRSETRTVLNSDNKLNRPVIGGEISNYSPEFDTEDINRLPHKSKSKLHPKNSRLVAKLDGQSSPDSPRSMTESTDKKPPLPHINKSDNNLKGSLDTKSSRSSLSQKSPRPQNSIHDQFEPEDVSMLQQIKDMKIREGQRRPDIPKWLNKEDFNGNKFDSPPESRGSSRNKHRSENKSTENVDDFISSLDDVLSQKSSRENEKPSSSRRNTQEGSSRHNIQEGSSRHNIQDEEIFASDGTPMDRIQKNRAKWRDSSLEESWGSLSFFNRSQKGRLSVDMADDALDEYLPSARKIAPKPAAIEEEAGEDVVLDDDFTIPELPCGRQLTLNIKSTWGDHHYVGLTGIEIFSSTGELVTITQVSASPSDINILPEYKKDPRVVQNIIDSCNRTRDDVHMWLTPFTPGSDHYVYLTLAKPSQIAMIRVWNYNKSRIHSYRGAKEVIMILDNTVIFVGEIARACGGIEGGTEAFGDTILFTTDENILEEVSKNDDAFEGELLGEADDEHVPYERPSTADDGKERPFTRAVGKISEEESQPRPETSYMTTVNNVTAYITKNLELNFTATWGDPHYLGLTALEVIGKDGEALPVKLSMLTANPRDLHSIHGHEKDDRTLDKLINGTSITTSDEHMWLIPFSDNKNHLLTITYPEKCLVTGLRIWNYNKSREDTYRGAKIVHIKINGRQISPSQGYLIRKGPGSCHFDFAQEISFSDFKSDQPFKETSSTIQTGGVDTSQDYEAVQMPCGFIYQFQLFSAWSDPYYIGLNGLELYNENFEKIKMTDNNISAYPDSVNVLDNVENDVRTPDKLINDVNDTTEGNNLWLAPILPSILNRVYVIFDQPTTVSMVKIWNYSKTPSRGVKDFALLVDDLLVYNGSLESVPTGVRGIIPTCSVPQKYHTVVFTRNPQILHKEKHTIINNQAEEQDIQLLNDKKIITKYSDSKTANSGKPVNQELRPKTSVTNHRKIRR